MTKLFNKLNLIFNFIASWFSGSRYKENTRKTLKFLWLLAKRTDTKIDDKLIRKIAFLLEFIDNHFIKNTDNEEKKNMHVAEYLTQDDVKLEGFDFQYNTGKGTFDVNALGFMEFSYDPSNGGLYVEGNKIL